MLCHDGQMDPARAGKAVSAVGRARNLSNERRVAMDVSAGGLVASLMRGSVLSEHQRSYRISVALANLREQGQAQGLLLNLRWGLVRAWPAPD